MKKPLRRRALRMFVHARRFVLSICALCIASAAVLVWPLEAKADSYPYYFYDQESLTADGTRDDFVYSQSSCVDAFSQHLGFRCLGGSRTAIRIKILGPACQGCTVDVSTQCQFQDDGSLGNFLESCGFGGFCPYGGQVSGNNCVVQSCPTGQVRDPQTGQCGPSLPTKNLGRQCTLVGNPCNAGTGTKFQAETLYRSATGFPLAETAYYNSRFDTALTTGSYGKGWKTDYGRGIFILSTGVVMKARADGSWIAFRPPASGTIYVPDADVADRLERLTDANGNTTGWKYTSSLDDSTELANANGGILSIADRAGNTLTYGFSDSSTPPSIAPGPGYLIAITDPWGRALHFTRDSENKILTLTDPAGGTFTFHYDAADNLASITYPDATVRQFVYNEPAYTVNVSRPNFLTGIIDENGNRFANFGYGGLGRATLSEHAGGADRVTLTYNPFVSTSVTDALGVTRTYGLTTMFGTVKGTGISGSPCPSCGPASVTYDTNGNIASQTDWNGNRTNHTYDLTRNLETQRVEGLTSSGATTAQTRTISTQWDTNFRLPTQIAEPLRITTNVYDADGSHCGARGALCSKTIQATTDADGSQGFSATTAGTPRTWTYTYNSHGFVLTANGPRADVSDVTTYTYYADNDADLAKRGNLATITDALGHTTNITAYNAHGQPLTIVDPNGLTTTLTYDARMRLTSRSVGGETTTYTHDNVGELTRVTLPDSSYLNYTYDAAHRLTGLQDDLGNSIAYTLDAMGNRTHEEVRDPANVLAQTRNRVYNNLNQLYQDIGASNQTTQYAYDNQGNVLSVTDPLNHITSNQYDALNRLIQVTDPGLGVTQYAYNGRDALTQVTDPRSLATGYSVDGLGNLTLQSSPDTGNTSNTYDAAGNLLTQTDAKSQVTTYAYDALNRVSLITFQDGSKQAYGYDVGANGIGRLTTITETDPTNIQTSLIQYGYDQHGRVVSDSRTLNGVTYVTAYRYDLYGRLDQVTYPSGRLVNYAFDGAGRISALTTTPPGGTATNLATGIAYQPFGGLKSFTFGNGQTYTRTYDQDGRIASYTLGSQTFGIGYDADSRIEFISETGNPSNSNTYGYDALDRLTSAVTPSTSYSYAYDAVGNRTSKTTGANTDTYAYSPSSNRIASITPSTGPVRSFVFDANGSTTADGSNTYAYDVRERMVSATNNAGTTAYQINALGQRVRKTNRSTDTIFIYDGQGHLIAENSASGSLVREYVWLGDMPVSVIDPTGSNFVHVDHLNTPRLVADATGTTVWKWDQQEPFGDSVPDENPSGLGNFDLPLRLPGQRYDQETGLHYNYYRDYDPSRGGYEESDPLGLNGGINTYLYGGAAPLMRIDPTGLVNWTGYQFNFAVASGFGAGYSQMDLFSECKCGRRYHIVVHGAGGAASIGVRVSATISEVSLDDGSACPDPTAFLGFYGSVSAGATLNALPIPGKPIVGLGARGPGVGMSVAISRYGEVSQPATANSASNFASPVVGRDLSITAVAGVTFVNVISVNQCCDKQR